MNHPVCVCVCTQGVFSAAAKAYNTAGDALRSTVCLAYDELSAARKLLEGGGGDHERETLIRLAARKLLGALASCIGERAARRSVSPTAVAGAVSAEGGSPEVSPAEWRAWTRQLYISLRASGQGLSAALLACQSEDNKKQVCGISVELVMGGAAFTAPTNAS